MGTMMDASIEVCHSVRSPSSSTLEDAVDALIDAGCDEAAVRRILLGD
jgi:hypothetical protein